MVYELITKERKYNVDGDSNFFSSYDLAYNSFVELKKEYMDSPSLRDIEICAKIKRIHLDDNDMDLFCFDNELRLVQVFPASKSFMKNDDCEIPDLACACYVYVPLPFKKGDLVKEQGIFGTEYGVMGSDQESRENDLCMRIGGDGTDMTVSLDIYIDWRKEFDYTDDTEALRLRYCTVEELPEGQKILEKLSQARKGEIDWFTLLLKE